MGIFKKKIIKYLCTSNTPLSNSEASMFMLREDYTLKFYINCTKKCIKVNGEYCNKTHVCFAKYMDTTLN